MMGRLLFALAVAVFFNAHSVSAQCIDYGDHLHWVGGADTGYTQIVATEGEYAYVFGLGEGLKVIDISNPHEPGVVGDIDLSVHGGSLVVQGGYAYLAESSTHPVGLQIVDVTTPGAPEERGSVDLADFASGVAVQGVYAYVANWSLGLQVVDVTNPAMPVVVGNLPTTYRAIGVAVQGSYAYVSCSATYAHGQVLVVDISTPETPTLIGSTVTPDNAPDIVVQGDYAFVACGDEGLLVVDVSIPSSPSIILTVEDCTDVDNVAINGNLLFAGRGAWSYDFQVLDITVPVSAHVLSTVRTTSAWDIASTGDIALVVNGSTGFAVFDVTSPTEPTAHGSFATTGQAEDVAVDGDLAFVAVGASGLQVVNVSDPSLPTLVGAVDTPGLAYGIAVRDDYAYIADRYAGLQIVDVSTPATPQIVGGLAMPDSALSVVVRGDYAYVANKAAGLQIVNISSPDAPSITGTSDTPGEAFGVALRGDHAYVADGQAGLQVINIADPEAPVIVGNIDTPDFARQIGLMGVHAYIADTYSGLQVVDISVADSPGIVGSLDMPVGAGDVVLLDHVAYVSNGRGYFAVDITVPDSPAVIGGLDAPEFSYGIAVGQAGVFIAHYFGLVIAPRQCGDGVPVFLSSFDLVPGAARVTVRWGVSHLGDSEEFHLSGSVGNTVWDVPYVEIGPGAYLAEDICQELSLGAPVTYRLTMSDGDGRWLLLAEDVVTPEPTMLANRLVGTHPNPFNPQSTIAYECPTPGDVRLTVHDLSGRLVSVLVDERMTTGRHETTWSGRDGAGRAVAAGQYIVRLETREGIDTRKIVLAK